MGQLSKQVGKRIKEIREARGIKQCLLAEKLNMEPSNLTRIESGYQLPKEENLVKIATCLNVDVKDLFDFSTKLQKGEIISEIVDILEKLSLNKLEFVYDFVRLYEIRK